MTDPKRYDVIILGGGPGGYVAAIRAAQLGLKTALVEKQHLGGICLNWGCIPTKALLRSAEVYHLFQQAEAYGLRAENITFDLEKIVARSRHVSAQLIKGIEFLLKKNNVDVLMGTGRLAGKTDPFHHVQIEAAEGEKKAQTLSSPHVILATGAKPRILPGLEPDQDRIWTYREAMIPKSLPKSLLIVGSGAIGIEFASFYRTFGVPVTVVENQGQILPVEDTEIALFAQKQFEKQGIAIHTQTTVTQLKKEKDSIHATLQGLHKMQTLPIDRVIVAVGIEGHTEDLGLEKTKAVVDKGHIQTNAFCETAEPGIYAIGDVAGPPWLAHKASHEGMLCVENIVGQKKHTLNRFNIPGCTYSTPQIASLGLTEQKAKDKGYTLRVGRFPFRNNGKALALGEPEGLIKTIFDEKTGELLGAHMIGAEVTELIHSYSLAKTFEATEEDLIRTVFPHPTLSEMLHEAVLDAFGRAIHR